jgi:hypothetical protein
MTRSTGTGVYSPPPNITAVSGATIESGDWNALVNDLTTTFNTVLPASLGGTGVSSLTNLLSTIGGMPIAGGTFTGSVTMSGDAVGVLQPVTKQQFDAGLATKAATSHTHVVANVTDFSAGVATAIGATSINALSDVATSAPAVGHVLRWNGTNFVNVLPYVEFNAGTLGGVGIGATKFTAAHGIGARPYFVVAFFRCKTASEGFAVGDEIQTLSVLNSTSSFGVQVSASATNVYGSANGPFYAFNLSIGSVTSLTETNFDLIIRAFR